MSNTRVLIYLLRRDLRVADNPIFHEFARMHSQSHKPFTHLLPLYVFNPVQQEVSGFLSSPDQKSPFPEARSQVGKFWRCGSLRAKFIAESIWDTKKDLEKLGSGLEIRVGNTHEVVKNIMEQIEKQGEGAEVAGLWMTGEAAIEEKREERAVRKVVEGKGKEFKLWHDEKYFVDDRDLPFEIERAEKCPDVFTSFKKSVEPLREAPRRSHPTPKGLPEFLKDVPSQQAPFTMPNSLDGLIQALQKPLHEKPDLSPQSLSPNLPSGAHTAIPFNGGSKEGHARIKHLLQSGAMTTYKDTRNGMLGADFSTKLSAFLAMGSITARQVHEYLLDFEDGNNEIGRGARGYGKGENKGTGWVRFELLWRDYMRLVTLKFGPRLFREDGFRQSSDIKWRYDKGALQRWMEGSTGTGLIDASQRELWYTGYTSNRARQNVASFLAKHLELDWRVGAEWYESNLVDYDVSSNWGNWQYNAGVGNDPREAGSGRKFNPVKQGWDYDPKAEYVKTWCPELRELGPDEAFQSWKAKGKKEVAGTKGAEHPLVRINFGPPGKGKGRR